MAIGFSLSQDNQNSYDHQEKEKIDRWFQKLRITLSALHKEQLQELEQSQQDFKKNNDDIENYN